MKEKWNDLLRRRIKETKINRTKFAERVGVTNAALGHWLNGTRSPNNIEQIARMFHLAGIDSVTLHSDGLISLKEVRTPAKIEGIDKIIEKEDKMTSIFDKVKDDIIKAQLATTPNSRLLDNIVEGKETLLSEEEIIARLGISREEFIGWVRESDAFYQVKKGSVEELNAFAKVASQPQHTNKTTLSFPKPDLYLAGKARWRKKTFRKWLEVNAKI